MNSSSLIKSSRISIISLLAISAFILSRAEAATQYWDADGTGAVGNPPTAGTGGTGTWNTSNSLWWNGSSYGVWGGDVASFYNYTGSASTVTVSGTISANGISFEGTGSATTISSGTLNLTGSATLNASTSPSNSGGGTISSAIIGVNGLTKTGTGHLFLSGNNSGLTGGITLNAGSVQISTQNNLGTNAVTVASGATLSNSAASGTYTNNFSLAGIGSTNGYNNGNGALRGGGSTFSGTITLAADARITGGVFTGIITGAHNLEIGSSVTGPSGSLVTTLSNSGNNYTGNTTITGPLGGSSATTVKIGVAGGAIANGAGVGDLVMNGGNTSARQAILDLNGNNETVNGLRTGINAANVVITNSSTAASTSTLTVGDNNATGNNFGGVIQNGSGTTTVAFTKIGTGVQTLSGTNTYSGTTSVNAGTLLINGSLSSASSVSVNSTGILGGTGTAAGIVAVKSGGSIAPGAGAIGTLASGALSLESGGTIALELNTTLVTSDKLNVTGGFNVGAGSLLSLADLGSNAGLSDGTVFTLLTYTTTWNGGFLIFNSTTLTDDSIFTFGVNSYQISYNGIDGLTNALTLQTVPEPSALALIVGTVGLFAVVRRRRRSN